MTFLYDEQVDREAPSFPQHYVNFFPQLQSRSSPFFEVPTFPVVVNIGVPSPEVFLSRLLRMPDLTVQDSEVRTHVLTIATEDDRPRAEAIERVFEAPIGEVEENALQECRGSALSEAWGRRKDHRRWLF